MVRSRRSVAVVAIALATTLSVATGVAVDRLTPAPDPFAVRAITPSFTVLPVADAPAKPAPPKRAAPANGCPSLPTVPADAATAARAIVPRVDVHDRPGGRVLRTLTNPTDEAQPLHALVHEQRGTWLRIQLVARPNGSTGWVRSADFAQYPAPYRIVVQRCAKRLTVFRAGRVVWERPAAVGKPSTPTPLGAFFVDFVTPMKCCAYGPMMLSVAGFSNVLFQFGKGGTGQIAIHGTNADWSVGKAASNGCVRLHNADVVALARMIPGGTPVTVVD